MSASDPLINPERPAENAPEDKTKNKVIRKYTRTLVGQVLNEMLEATEQEIKDKLTDPLTPMIDKIIGEVILDCFKNKSWSMLEPLLERVIGKVPQKVEGEFLGAGGTALPTPIINFFPVIPIPVDNKNLVEVPPEEPKQITVKNEKNRGASTHSGPVMP
jgi:hypothetical protein